MCSTSVEPMPSRISTPKRARNRSNSAGGSASPADTAAPDARQVELPLRLGVRQQHRVVRRHGEEQRRTVALDDVVDRRRRDRPGPEDGRRADRQGKVHAVAQAVGEEQLGDAEAPVVARGCPGRRGRRRRRTPPCRAADARSPSAGRCCRTNTARRPARRGSSAPPRVPATQRRQAPRTRSPRRSVAVVASDHDDMPEGRAAAIADAGASGSAALTMITRAAESRSTNA